MTGISALTSCLASLQSVQAGLKHSAVQAENQEAQQVFTRSAQTTEPVQSRIQELRQGGTTNGRLLNNKTGIRRLDESLS